MNFKVLLSILLTVQLSSCNILNMPSDIQWTKAINAKLCEPGAHPDDIATKFFACYDEQVVPGGTQFTDCAVDVYGVNMDTEAHIDSVCNASSDKFPKYAACILFRLTTTGHLPSTAMHKLNVCQGGLMGVPAPA